MGTIKVGWRVLAQTLFLIVITLHSFLLVLSFLMVRCRRQQRRRRRRRRGRRRRRRRPNHSFIHAGRKRMTQRASEPTNVKCFSCNNWKVAKFVITQNIGRVVRRRPPAGRRLFSSCRSTQYIEWRGWEEGGRRQWTLNEMNVVERGEARRGEETADEAEKEEAGRVSLSPAFPFFFFLTLP